MSGCYKMYQKNFSNRKFLAYTILGAGVAGLCYYVFAQDSPDSLPQRMPAAEEKKYFDDFGIVHRFKLGSRVSVELGDMDGDGDLDLVVTEENSGIVRILENRIQKKGAN